VEQQAHTSGQNKPAKPSSISETTDNLINEYGFIETTAKIQNKTHFYKII